MMQRKKKLRTGEYAQLDIITANDDDDRGGVGGYSSTKKQQSSSRIISSLSTSSDCLPGVPPAFKLILLSFVGFALLVVLTAKGHHNRWHYRVGGGNRAPASSAVRNDYLPESLLDKVRRRKWERSRNAGGAAVVRMKSSKNDEDRDDALPPSSSSRRQKHTSSQHQQQQQQRSTIGFVESEKRLKRQLRQLATTQKNDGLLLGVPISNRYLGGEDDILLLPYPAEGTSLEEWTRNTERRTEEIVRLETRQWDGMIRRYYEENMKKNYDDMYHPSSPEVPPGAHHEDEGATTTTTTILEDRRRRKWPSPLAMAPPDTSIILRPSFGAHRRDEDAILVFAEGYDLSVYMSFVESLSSTGYDGDLVLSIARGSKLKPHVEEYLRSINTNNNNTGDANGVNIIAYEVDWSCYKSDTSGVSVNDANGGQSHCRMNNVFGTTTSGTTANSSTTAVEESISEDPRTPRPVATARYELYWIWCLQYTSSSWIMLIDARDTWFQLHPFGGLGGGGGNDDSISSSSNNSSSSSSNKEDDKERRGIGGGELHFFGENADAIRIGTSAYNRNWLITAYGEKHVLPYYTQPVICSGSTIGNQIAIESYLRAMVYQFDSTLCKLKGCDQGFHNYLYYSGKLVGGGGKGGDGDNDGISKIIVHEQGHGTINNLAALRAKPLSEQGLYDPKREVVLNWDGSVSAVAHQYDRDKEVNNMVKGKKRLFESNWMKQQQQQQQLKR